MCSYVLVLCLTTYSSKLTLPKNNIFTIPTTGDIGYGPAVSQSAIELSSASGKKGSTQEGFHPPAPPIKRSTDKVDGSEDVLQFDSNFIMMKKSDTSDKIEQVRTQMPLFVSTHSECVTTLYSYS